MTDAGRGGQPNAGLQRATAHPGVSWDRTDQRLLSVLVVSLVLTHRLGLPLGDAGVSLALPTTYLLAGALVWRRRLIADRLRAEMYFITITAILIVTALVSLRGDAVSLTSVGFFMAIYLPWVLRVTGDVGRAVVLAAGRTFVRVVLVLAGLGVAQLVTQLIGVWEYQDYLESVVPQAWLVSGYNTDIPLVYGSPTYKANGFVLLEPSFLSQYCALAVLIGLMLQIRPWKILLLLTGLASAVSGTGILLLGAGLLFMVARARHRIRPVHVITGLFAMGLVLLSPTSALLLDRTDEFTQSNTSGNARFVRPFIEVANALADQPHWYFTGAGAGSADRLLPSPRTGVDVLYGPIPKVAFEYGLIIGGLVIVFLLLALLDRPPWRVIPGALVVMTFLLSGGLLQPQTAMLAWVFSGLGTNGRFRGAAESGSPRGPSTTPDGVVPTQGRGAGQVVDLPGTRTPLGETQKSSR